MKIAIGLSVLGRHSVNFDRTRDHEYKSNILSGDWSNFKMVKTSFKLIYKDEQTLTLIKVGKIYWSKWANSAQAKLKCKP